jgi:hypothetical protein
MMRKFRWLSKMAVAGAVAAGGLSLGVPAAQAGARPTITASCTPLLVGGNCTIAGRGFQPSFQVRITVLSGDLRQDFGQKTLTADGSGNIEPPLGTIDSGNPVPDCTNDVLGYYGQVWVAADEFIPPNSGIPSPGTVWTQITAEIGPCQLIIWRP